MKGRQNFDERCSLLELNKNLQDVFVRNLRGTGSFRVVHILENCDRRQTFTKRSQVIGLLRNICLVQVKRTVNDAGAYLLKLTLTVVCDSVDFIDQAHIEV